MNAKFYSMTGYAHLEKSIGKQRYRIHLKSVNHRFSEIRFKVPRSWSAIEISAKKILQEKLLRGSIDFWVEDLSQELSANEDKLNLLFSRLKEALEKSVGFSKFTLPGPVRALILARFPEYWLSASGAETSIIDGQEILKAIEELIELLKTERSSEGERVVTDLLQYSNALDDHYQTLKQRVPKLRMDWEQKLRERMDILAKELQVPSLPQERLLQEFLMLAEKRDVAEELQRIEMHLSALKTLFKNPRPDGLGKRLEFLLQELHREWTTFGNKVQNSGVGSQIVEAKILLERLREQALNLV